jgi:hypothetical protein
MKIFNEYGDFLGEFTEAAGGVIENTKDTVCSWFEAGIFLGIIGLFISPFWAILAIVAILILKLFVVVLKFALNCAWWVVRLPFCLLFRREIPEF